MARPHPTGGLTRRRALRLAVGSVGLVLVATGCGGQSTPPTPSAAATTAAAPSTVAPLAQASPTGIATPAATALATVAPTIVPTVAPTLAPTAAPTITPTPAPQGMTSPDYGIQVFLWGSAAVDRDLRLVKEMGFRWVKQQLEWRYVEPHQKGVLEWNEPDRLVAAIEKAGLKLVARLDSQPVWARADKVFPADGPPDKLQDYVDFVQAVAQRYKGRIQAYEIWNEPNLALEWGNKPPNPKDYVAMLKGAYQAIKSVDPGAQIITAGLAPTTASGAVAMPDVDFVKAMYQAGAKPYFDLLGVHGAGYKAPPDASPDSVATNPLYNHNEPGLGRIYCFRHVEDVRKVMVDQGDADKRVAVLELGWTTDSRQNSLYHWFAVSQQQQADYLVGAYSWAKQNWQPWIGLMSMIYIASPDWTPDSEEYWWAITNPDGTPRPAYNALASMAK